MINVIFKNLNKSDLIRRNIENKMESVIGKFPDLESSRLEITVEMHNSPFHRGADSFSVKIQISGGLYSDTRLQKKGITLYEALSELTDVIQDRLARVSAKERLRKRKKERKFLRRVELAFARNSLKVGADSIAHNFRKRRDYA